MPPASSPTEDFAITPLPSTHVLSRIGEDLTVLAHQSKLANIFSRDLEIDQMIKILGRTGKCNPLILGEAGVGKTTLCRSLANKIVNQAVPKWLQGRKIIRTSFFDIWGAIERSENDFSEYARLLKQVLKVCRESPVILFMDEFHMLVDYPVSANVIKPALADGSLRLIAATTLRDYRFYLEKDEALTRRFIPIVLEEPSKDLTRQILLSLKPAYQKRYGVTFSDSLITQAVDMSDTYIQNRNQPDKSIDLLELSCIETAYKRPLSSEPLEVTVDILKEVTSSVTGIPQDILAGNTDRLTGLVQTLTARYVGQEEAIQQIANRLIVTKSRLNLEVQRPDGVFLISGPPGVGKTALARSLAGLLSDHQEDFIQLDMGLFQTPNSLSFLLGQGKGGGADDLPFLTFQIKNRPSALLLLENIDQAHEDILKVFQQIFARGKILDFQGTEINFDHVTILITTRLGFENGKRPIGLTHDLSNGNWENQKQDVIQAIQKRFLADFLQHIDEIVVLKPLTEEMLKGLMAHKVRKWSKQISKNIVLSNKLVKFLISNVSSEEAPTYPLVKLIDQKLGEQIQRLRRVNGWEKLTDIHFDLSPKGQITTSDKRNAES